MAVKKATKRKSPAKAAPQRVREPTVIPPGMSIADWMAQQAIEREEGTKQHKMFYELAAIANTKMTAEMKAAYCIALSKLGRKTHAAQAIGVTPETILRHRRLDPDFDVAAALAERTYADWVIQKVQDMAFNGVVTERKIVYDEQGEEDGIIVKRQYLPALVQMEARRVEPEYRDKQEVKVDVTQSHVLMVPEQAKSTEDWEAFAIEQQVSKPDDE